MRSRYINCIVFFLLFFTVISTFRAKAQGGYEALLFEEVDVPNPVYMPVIGIGPGIGTYFGELDNDTKNLLRGKPSLRINIHQYIDKMHYFRGNIFIILGTLTGVERNYQPLNTDVSLANSNTNFESTIFDVGVSFEYNFGHWIKGEDKVRPFISLGGEYFSFNSKTDLILDATGENYLYLPDGTIRTDAGNIIERDYEYETDLRDLDLYGRGKYNKNSMGVVVDAGLDFPMSDRVTFRLGTSLHYTFTDDIDNISSDNAKGRIGDNMNDMFSLTYITLNLDLFSDDETIILEKYFAEITGEFSYDLIADEDNDGITDLYDDCPGTPPGVAVNDTTGCPLDGDEDGVPDYLDKEPITFPGSIVDEQGKSMTDDELIAELPYDLEAVDRSAAYMMPIDRSTSIYSQGTVKEIPPKYKSLDTDNDGYISYQELLQTINNFFDFESELTADDIYELNEFFFAQ